MLKGQRFCHSCRMPRLQLHVPRSLKQPNSSSKPRAQRWMSHQRSLSAVKNCQRETNMPFSTIQSTLSLKEHPFWSTSKSSPPCSSTIINCSKRRAWIRQVTSFSSCMDARRKSSVKHHYPPYLRIYQMAIFNWLPFRVSIKARPKSYSTFSNQMQSLWNRIRACKSLHPHWYPTIATWWAQHRPWWWISSLHRVVGSTERHKEV